MNNLVEETFVTVSQLPEAEQNAIASLILQKISAPSVAPLLTSQSDIETIEKAYIFRDKTEVIDFINKYPFLLPVVLEAPVQISNYSPNKDYYFKSSMTRKFLTIFIWFSQSS